MVNHLHVSQSRRAASGGTALIEFAIVMGVMIPMFFGMVVIGLSSTSGIQAVQVTRDLGHMYSLGVDFSSATTNDEEAQQIAMNLPLTSTGTGVVIFTQIKAVVTADCTAQGINSGCNNAGSSVITQRLVLGNSSVRSSTFGSPSAGFFNAKGNATPANYLVNGAFIASNAGILPVVPLGNSVYVTESYFQLPVLQFLSPFGTPMNGVYSICYF